MKSKERLRRTIRLTAIAFSKGQAVPMFASRALNRAVDAEAKRIRQERTARRYSRSDNHREIACAA